MITEVAVKSTCVVTCVFNCCVVETWKSTRPFSACDRILMWASALKARSLCFPLLWAWLHRAGWLCRGCWVRCCSAGSELSVAATTTPYTAAVSGATEELQWDNWAAHSHCASLTQPQSVRHKLQYQKTKSQKLYYWNLLQENPFPVAQQNTRFWLK